jgi:hypothetical protein
MGSVQERSGAAPWLGIVLVVVAVGGVVWPGRAGRAPAGDGPTGVDLQEAVDTYRAATAGANMPALVELCVSLDTACSLQDRPPGHTVAVEVPGFAGDAVLWGDPEVLADWTDVRWTTDVDAVEW